MRMVLVGVVVAVCGCDVEQPVAPDAGQDAAMHDADPMARVYLSPGEYSLTWECVEECQLTIPAASYDRLTVTETALECWYSECAGCERAIDTISGRDVDCVSGRGIPQGDGAAATDPYDVCREPGAAVATIRYAGYPGPPTITRVWTMSARPL